MSQIKVKKLTEKKKEAKVTFTIRLDKESLKKLDSLSLKYTDCNRSELIRMLISSAK